MGLDAETLKRALTRPQYEAVTSDARASLVLAGAGSGKTRVLVYKIARLLQEAAPDADGRPLDENAVMAVTFTNKAADEMRARIQSYLGRPVRMPWMGTFHSICVRILRRHLPEENGPRFRGRSFSIFDDDDQRKVCSALLKDPSLRSSGLTPKALQNAISSWKSAFVSWEEAARDAVRPEEREKAELYRKYEKTLAANNALDFDDLLLHAVRLLESDPAVLGALRRRFRHLFVDEYQDTNAVQYRFVRLLAQGGGATLTVVGDDDQSIYSWRGADVRNLHDFVKDFPEARVYKLEENFRSTSNIVSAAGSVIRNNERIPGLEKEVFSSMAPGDPVRVVRRFDEDAQAAFVADVLSRMAPEELENVAVFYRKNAQSRKLEKVFSARRVPCRIYGGVGFFQRREVKDVVAYLRVLVNPADDVSLERIVNVPRRGIGETTVARLRALAEADGTSLFDALARAQEVLSAAAAKKILAFRAFLDGLVRLAGTAPLPVIVSEVVAGSGYREALLAEGGEEARDRVANVDELLNDAEEREEASPGSTLADFLEDAALATDADREGAPGPAVRLMTLHAAKGLEFDDVFIVGCCEGVLPIASFGAPQSELEEERRLFYVGMTRARKRLWLIHPRAVLDRGMTVDTPPSRFLAELDPRFCEFAPERRIFLGSAASGESGFSDEEGGDDVVQYRPAPPTPFRRQGTFRLGNPYVRPGARPPIPRGSGRAAVRPASELLRGGSSEAEMSQENLYLRVGARVRHPRFGFGVVLAASGTSPSDRVEVRFADGSTRCLVLKFASLTVVG